MSPVYVSQHVRKILQQMETVGHLTGRGRPKAHRLRIRLRALPNNDLHPGIRLQPLGHGLDFPVGEEGLRIHPPEPFEVFMTRDLVINDFRILPIELTHVAPLTTMPFHHRGPFDRLLMAQSMVEQIPMVNGDTAFDAYPMTRLS